MDKDLIKNMLRSSSRLAWPYWIPQVPSSVLKRIHKEIHSLSTSSFRPQVSKRNIAWNQLVLRGIDAHSVGHFTRYGFRDAASTPWQWVEDNCQQLPLCKELVASTFDCLELHRVALHQLLPGGKISAHTDDLKGIEAAFLVALDWPPQCHLLVNQQEVRIQTGDIFHINYMKSHEVYNESSRARYALSVMGSPRDPALFCQHLFNSQVDSSLM